MPSVVIVVPILGHTPQGTATTCLPGEKVKAMPAWPRLPRGSIPTYWLPRLPQLPGATSMDGKTTQHMTPCQLVAGAVHRHAKVRFHNVFNHPTWP